MHRRNALIALCTTAVLAVPAAANAAPLTDSYALPIASSSVALGSHHIDGNDPVYKSAWSVDVSTKASWSGSLATAVGWNSSNVRQGSPLAVSRVSPLQSGTLHVTWKLTGWKLFDTIETDVDATLAKNAWCAPQLIGGAYDCTAESPDFTLGRWSSIPNGYYFKLHFK